MNRTGLVILSAIVVMVAVAQVPRRAQPKAEAEVAVQSKPKVDDAARYRAVQAAASRGGDTELRRGTSGQFHLTARVNGDDTEFLVDTGADVVALTVDDARRLGISVDPANFQPLMRTASGTGRGALVELRSIEVAGHEFQNVTAVVMEGLEVNLLGQSVLRRFGSVELSGDRMVIRPG
jgi:aspartyl protease family protein